MLGQKKLWLFMFFISWIFSPVLLAKDSLNNTPRKVSDYEPYHQGVLSIRAGVFYSPCNYHLQGSLLLLTDCGAGNSFQKLNLRNTANNIPAKLQIYDVLGKRSLSHQIINLSDGDNVVSMPFINNNQNPLRLEVSYE